MPDYVGSISTEFTIWCGRCTDWNTKDATKAEAIRLWRKLGWKKLKDVGWTCPKCVVTLASEVRP